MRKRLITPIPQDAPPRDEGWLDLDRAAVVEVTSEESSGSSRTRTSAATERSDRSASRYSGRILRMPNGTPRTPWQMYLSPTALRNMRSIGLSAADEERWGTPHFSFVRRNCQALRLTRDLS